MAFEWNWQPTPLNLKPYDDRSKAASTAMQGYVPNDANINVVGSPQAIAQSNMEGYIPYDATHEVIAKPGFSISNIPPNPTASGQVLGGEGGANRAPYGDYGQGWIYTQNVQTAATIAEIDQKIAANNATIARLEKQLQTAKYNSEYSDDLDRRLAANRVKANDYANAQTHLGRIEARKLAREQHEYAERMAEKNKGTATDKAKRELIGQIEDLDMAIPYYENKQSRDAAIAKRNRLVDQLNTEYKTNVPHYGQSADDTLTSDEWEQFKIANTDKNGNWTSDAARKLYSTRKTLNADEAQKAKAGGETKTAAEVKADWNKVQADFESVVKSHGNPAKYVGSKVTLDVNGKPVEFEVSYDSQNKRYVYKAKGHTIYKKVGK